MSVSYALPEQQRSESERQFTQSVAYALVVYSNKHYFHYNITCAYCNAKFLCTSTQQPAINECSYGQRNSDMCHAYQKSL
jgi:hypothetical protein